MERCVLCFCATKYQCSGAKSGQPDWFRLAPFTSPHRPRWLRWRVIDMPACHLYRAVQYPQNQRLAHTSLRRPIAAARLAISRRHYAVVKFDTYHPVAIRPSLPAGRITRGQLRPRMIEAVAPAHRNNRLTRANRRHEIEGRRGPVRFFSNYASLSKDSGSQTVAYIPAQFGRLCPKVASQPFELERGFTRQLPTTSFTALRPKKLARRKSEIHSIACTRQ